MRLRLYVIPGSHPCETARAALDVKGLSYERVDMLPVIHKLHGRLAYRGRTAPGLRIDSERITGSRAILRRLEQLAPDPPLWPADPARRAAVEHAERWGDEVLQPIPRRLGWAIMSRRPAVMAQFAVGARLPLPLAVTRPTFPLVARTAKFANHADDETVKADLAALPGLLDRVDGWIDAGVLGGESPNAADLQIGSSVRLMLAFGDLRPLIDERPCRALAGHFTPLAADVPAGILDPAWLPATAAA
jgi:glutathione S-transferase